MDLFLGADLGTSSIKLVLMDEKGSIVSSSTEDIPLLFPHPSWSEQNPSSWVEAFKKALNKICDVDKRKMIKGICIDGQMHGLVVLDEDYKVIRPAILWNDERTKKETEELNENPGKEELIKLTGNIAYAGFTAPKILWMKHNEPSLFNKIRHIMLPKDYLNFYLTGILSTDYSDAAGTLLLDVKNKEWSKKMIDIIGIKKEYLPKLYSSLDLVGNVKKEVCSELGLNKDVFVLAGAGDNAASAIGSGVINNSEANISLGTSGTIFVDSDKYAFDKNGAIHSFLSAKGGYCLLACMLSAASCLKWLNESIFMTSDFQGEQKKINVSDLGNNNVFFLPYLMGERSPINDPDARGLFIGLTQSSSRKDITLAVLEGVAFALKDSLVSVQKMGVNISESCLTGGGAKSELWQNIIANILNIRLNIVSDRYGPSYGMGMCCLVHQGIFKDLEDATNKLIRINYTVVPNKELVDKYQEKYKKFSSIYPSVKELYKKLDS